MPSNRPTSKNEPVEAKSSKIIRIRMNFTPSVKHIQCKIKKKNQLRITTAVNLNKLYQHSKNLKNLKVKSSEKNIIQVGTAWGQPQKQKRICTFHV